MFDSGWSPGNVSEEDLDTRGDGLDTDVSRRSTKSRVGFTVDGSHPEVVVGFICPPGRYTKVARKEVRKIKTVMCK